MIKTTVWRPTSQLEVVVDSEPWRLPLSLQHQIDEYWRGLLAQGKPFFRGPVLSVRSIHQNNRTVTIEGVVTDYAHYLFSRTLAPDHPYQVRVMFAAACLVSRDNWLICGVMGPKTSRPGWIQAIGGSASDGDIVNGYFNPVLSAQREAQEEVGLNISASVCQIKGYTEDEMGRVAIAVSMPLHDDAEDIIAVAQRHVQKCAREGTAELSDVLSIPISPKGLSLLDSQTRPVVRYLKAIVEGFYTGG